MTNIRYALSSVMNIWVWFALSLRGARPLPGTLKVRLAKEGGLTFITPPRFVLLFPTVPAAKLCICDCMVKGLHFSDLFMLLVIAITAFFIVRSCEFWLGDILPQGHFAPRTKCPKTKCPKDILPQDILPQIAQTFGRWTYCPNCRIMVDILPHF